MSKKPKHANIAEHSRAVSVAWKELDDERRSEYRERAKTVHAERKLDGQLDFEKEALSLAKQAVSTAAV